MVHDFDMARFLIGDEVEEVFAAVSDGQIEGGLSWRKSGFDCVISWVDRS
jgi:hypothetical protein